LPILVGGITLSRDQIGNLRRVLLLDIGVVVLDVIVVVIVKEGVKFMDI
jgi:hypothetical protein